MGNFLKERLFKTRQTIFGRIKNLLAGKNPADEIRGEIEEILITSDISASTARYLLSLDDISGDRAGFIAGLKKRMLDLLGGSTGGLPCESRAKPLVLMMVGVNGVGKTTTIGKLAKAWSGEGKKGILAACDTYRAAAVDQLEILGGKTGLRVIKQRGGDAASVAFDSMKAALAGGYDFLMLDTAGRLHTKHNLMEELKKIKRVIAKEGSVYPQEIILVLDATLGQNALSQVKEFHDALGLTGIVMTKMDGTAKGGILLSLAKEYKIPVRYIGVGEGLDDLVVFDREDFVDAIFS